MVQNKKCWFLSFLYLFFILAACGKAPDIINENDNQTHGDSYNSPSHFTVEQNDASRSYSDYSQNNSKIEHDNESASSRERPHNPLNTNDAISIVYSYTNTQLDGGDIGFLAYCIIEYEDKFYYQVQGYKMYEENEELYYDTNSSVVSKYFVNIYSGEVISLDDISPQSIISMRDAELIAYKAYGQNDKRNLFLCEGLNNVNGELKYHIRFYNSLPDHRTTIWWYNVDVYTGEITSAFT